MADSVIQTDQNLLEGFLSITDDLNSTHDLDFLLNKILTEARRFVSAEAGSIYLVEGDTLKFCYVQNDKMPHGQSPDGAVGSTMAVDDSSLAGYAAMAGEQVVIDDAYLIDSSKPYAFNRGFDDSTGYRTKSMLTVPMQTSRGKVVGVLQLINAVGGEGAVVPFQEWDQMYVGFYANSAAVAVERATITRELILRTIRMAELRDPKETGAHVNRVASYCAEIYGSWAQAKGLEEDYWKKQKDIIRVAAMLHDVGKVAISDTILKKPGRLTSEEYGVMKYHTVYGAQLFASPISELDQMAQVIALNHHERFDGRGYPGYIEDIYAEDVQLGKGIGGEDIPLEARIASLADVYDALISPRVYKEPWPENKVLETIKHESGAQFDPDVVEAFFNVYDIISIIRSRFSD